MICKYLKKRYLDNNGGLGGKIGKYTKWEKKGRGIYKYHFLSTFDMTIWCRDLRSFAAPLITLLYFSLILQAPCDDEDFGIDRSHLPVPD